MTILQGRPGSATAADVDAGSPRIPPLENGDHLTRDEFERRYQAMPQLKKAELIEGKVYMGSPVSHLDHGLPHSRTSSWLTFYCLATPGVEFGDNSTVRLDFDSEPQPDLVLLVQRGGQTEIDQDGYLAGPPEMALEIAASSANYDLHEKLRAYLRNGVREYFVWRTLDGEVDWFVLRGSDYARLSPGEDGILRSEVFPGLWLDPTALLSADLRRLFEVVRQGVAAPGHAAFAAEPAKRAAAQKPG